MEILRTANLPGFVVEKEQQEGGDVVDFWLSARFASWRCALPSRQQGLPGSRRGTGKAASKEEKDLIV